MSDITEKEARMDMKEPIDFITSGGCGKTGISWHFKCAPMINKMFESITFSKPTAMNPKLLKHLKSRYFIVKIMLDCLIDFQ